MCLSEEDAESYLLYCQFSGDFIFSQYAVLERLGGETSECERFKLESEAHSTVEAQ